MITLNDVAKTAGVSTSTVSIVVNNRKVRGVSVSPATRERVLSIARQMGYTPNSLARAVVTGKNRVFGLIKDDLSTDLGMSILLGAQQECDRSDYLIKPFQLPDPTRWDEVVDKCLSQRVAGIIVINLSEETTRAIWERTTSVDVPLVIVDQLPGGDFGHRITSDDMSGVKMMVDHIISMGHRRIAFIGGETSIRLSGERKGHFRDALAANGLSIHEEDILDGSWGAPEPVERAVMRLLDREAANRPTAIFCAGDATAMMAIRSARRMGFALPKDVSIAGYSEAPYAYLSDPALTTVAQDFKEMGRTAARCLLAGRDWPDTGPVTTPTRLVVRESVFCGPFYDH